MSLRPELIDAIDEKRTVDFQTIVPIHYHVRSGLRSIEVRVGSDVGKFCIEQFRYVWNGVACQLKKSSDSIRPKRRSCSPTSQLLPIL